MINIETARKAALLLPDVEEKKHFERPDFRVNKKIFAVLHEKDHRMVVKLNIIDQSVFCAFDASVIYPVPGAWGRKGWTFINLVTVKKSMFNDALETAWKSVATKGMVEAYRKKK